MLKSEIDALTAHLVAHNAQANDKADYLVAGFCLGLALGGIAGYCLKMWGG